jgi:osmotically-inducible protein OsmY
MQVKAALAIAMIAALSLGVGACSISTTPGGGTHAEWIGTHQKEQAAERDQDRATALRVQHALENDPVLAPLDLKVFVDHGHVRLCGHFPDQTTRDRAFGVTETLKGVESVDTHCGQ